MFRNGFHAFAVAAVVALGSLVSAQADQILFTVNTNEPPVYAVFFSAKVCPTGGGSCVWLAQNAQIYKSFSVFSEIPAGPVTFSATMQNVGTSSTTICTATTKGLASATLTYEPNNTCVWTFTHAKAPQTTTQVTNVTPASAVVALTYSQNGQTVGTQSLNVPPYGGTSILTVVQPLAGTSPFTINAVYTIQGQTPVHCKTSSPIGVTGVNTGSGTSLNLTNGAYWCQAYKTAN